MKKKLLLLLLSATLMLAGCGASDAFRAGMQDALNDSPGQNAPEEEISSETESEESNSTQSPNLDKPNSKKDVAEDTESKSTETTATSVPSSTAQSDVDIEKSTTKSDKIESGIYDIDGIEFSFSDSVRNDTTGNWRISLIADSATPDEYALDYYNTLFSSDNEIHGVINFSLNTTTRISILYEGVLDVTVLEYLDGEEHDAKELFGGDLLAEYWIHADTGEIEKIQ